MGKKKGETKENSLEVSSISTTNSNAKSQDKKYSKKSYIITAAQACYYEDDEGDVIPYGGGKEKAIPNYNFLNGLESLSQDIGAELMIVPIAGKVIKEDILHEDLERRKDIFKRASLRFNSNLQFQDVVVPPQNVDPTTGRANLVSTYGSSILFGHAKQRVLPDPVFNAKLPRYIYTTGAVTEPNYSRTNSRGDHAHRNHVFGALVVDVLDDKYYNIRNIRALKNGKFADLGREFNGDNVPGKMGVDSLVIGDWHCGDEDPLAVKASFDMIDFFKPDRIFLHDFYSGASVNPFEEKNTILRAREFSRGRLDLEKELQSDYKTLVELAKTVPKNTEINLVASNHHAFLSKYINSERWRDKDIWNAEICSYLMNKAIQLGKQLPEVDIDDAAYLLEEGFKRFGPIPENVRFLRLKDDYTRYGFQLASHGDKGKNGARGGNAAARSLTGGGKSITGHSHAMEVYGDTYIVGTNSRLDMPYTAGSSHSQIAANAILYKNGTVQMIPVIEGHWTKIE